MVAAKAACMAADRRALLHAGCRQGQVLLGLSGVGGAKRSAYFVIRVHEFGPIVLHWDDAKGVG